ncbi:MAG: helix-turn-helix domain-containing protein [Spirochaetaceae bacterium]|nr:helix-turn-helix domain-containing protein [Spirochaetaceae bacterium]
MPLQSLQAEYRDRIIRAVRFIEMSLSSPMSLEDAAAESAWSFFHFHRIFQAMMGIAPGEYLRMRRLSEAVRLLSSGDSSAAEIARAVGFGSPEAFSRSFKAQFGRTPGAYRADSGPLALMNPFGPAERPLVHRATCLSGDPVVSLYGPVRLAVKSRVFALENPFLTRRIGEFWDESNDDLARACGLPPGSSLERSYGIGLAEPGNEGMGMVYHAGIELTPGFAPPEGFTEFEIPRGEYLLALHRGPVSLLNETYLHLYGSWLPRSGRRPGAAMDFDFYGEGFDREDPESSGSTVEFRIPLAPI